MQKYYIIFSDKNRNKLTLIQCFDYEIDDYFLASRYNYEEKEEASKYMVELGKKHNIDVDDDEVFVDEDSFLLD